MEFDWGRNGTVDASTYLDMPEGKVTLYYTPPTGSGANFNSRLQPAVVNIAGNAEPYIGGINEPYPWADDNDGDGIPDHSDPDDDNDGIPDDLDMFPKDPAEKDDTDGDGVGDNADPDRDGDGVPNDQDKFPGNPSESGDHDGDGIGDNIDWDDDNDGTWDSNDSTPRGEVGVKPKPGTTGGGVANPINPGTPGGGGGGGGGDDGEFTLGNMGSPGGLTKPTTGEMDGMSEVPIADPFNGIGDFAADGLAEDIKAAGTGMKGLLAGWQPFQTYVPSGDMTTMVADLGRFGSVVIPFPAEPQNVGIFRGCCVFALYWGAVISVMRILRV